MIQHRQQLRFHNIKNDRQQLQKSSFRLKSGNVLNLRFVRNHPNISGIYQAFRSELIQIIFGVKRCIFSVLFYLSTFF